MKFYIILLFFMSTITGCASNTNKEGNHCTQGTTNLDGICVSQEVANYVGCVRARGAQLDQLKSHSLSADVGYFGVNASAAKEISENLSKKYSTSDNAMTSIIEQCNKTFGIALTKIATSPTFVASPQKTKSSSWPVSISGYWSYSSGEGEAEVIENDGNEVIMYMTYTPNPAARPHYKLRLKRKDQILEGTWICLIKGLRGCGTKNDVTFKINQSGTKIKVLDSEDPYKHGLSRGFTLYKM